MKKAIRILVPIVLILAILASAVWYLFVYDREFTRDMLLMQARHFEARGNHKLSTWFYDTAYTYASNSEEIAIELAQQYSAAGNYTKAEYTLSRGIADGGGTPLYIALCKLYVEQDKLLDAVNMLDGITDPAIRDAIAALRPAAPTVDMLPDFYNQYISVTLTAESGVLYATADGTYPSTAHSPYTQPISLGTGETTIYALAVADNGLVSKLGIYGYTVGGVVEEITFADAAIEASVRELLDLRESDRIYSDMLWEITDFTIPAGAADYSDLSRLTYLKSLTVNEAASGQLEKLASLAYLEELTITNSSPSDAELTAIAALPRLRKLTLSGCGLSTVSPLSQASGLEYLSLKDNTIRNLAPLSGLTGLRELYLTYNAVTDLSDLSGLTRLEILDISYNSVTSIAPICGIPGITELYAEHNQLISLGNIQNLTGLRVLSAGYNQIEEIEKLAACTMLAKLDLSNNALADVTALGSLSALEELNISYNFVTVLPDLPENCPIVSFDASHNLLTDISPLRALSKLNSVYLDYNPELSDLTPLTGCPKLVLVNAYGTMVMEVSFLTEQSVIVNFDPTLS